jgi:transposase
MIWELTGQLDLGGFAEGIASREGSAGRASWDPRLLVSVWLYGYSEGISSAREIAREMEYEPGMRWLTGMEVINHHSLSDFRVRHGEALSELFSQLLVAMEQAGWVKLERVMHDGTKVRAQAGVDSFRREKTVREKLAQARELVEQDPQADGGGNKRREAAQQRARREREQRLQEALQELEKIQGSKDDAEQKAQARVSVSEPEARWMKHGDHAIAPSYNVQVSTDAAAGVIVGVQLTQSAEDSHQLAPAMDEVEKNLGRQPEQVVADGGYTNRESIERMEERKIDFIGSLPDPRERSEAAMKAVGIDPKFAPHFFILRPDSNTMTCPAGKPLGYVGQSRKRGNHYRQYRAEGQDCVGCLYQTQCCPRAPWKGRMVSRLESEAAVVVRFREKMGSEPAREIYRQRGAVAEFPFAWLKEKFGIRKFRVFGMAKAGLEALWACLAHNVMIWVRLCRAKGPAIAAI